MDFNPSEVIEKDIEWASEEKYSNFFFMVKHWQEFKDTSGYKERKSELVDYLDLWEPENRKVIGGFQSAKCEIVRHWQVPNLLKGEEVLEELPNIESITSQESPLLRETNSLCSLELVKYTPNLKEFQATVFVEELSQVTDFFANLNRNIKTLNLSLILIGEDWFYSDKLLISLRDFPMLENFSMAVTGWHGNRLPTVITSQKTSKLVIWEMDDFYVDSRWTTEYIKEYYIDGKKEHVNLPFWE